RIGEEELVPFMLPGETVLAVSDRPSMANGARRPALQQQHRVRVSPTDEPSEKFDVHTPGAPLIVEQIIRPTGLLDPKITLKPLKNQIDETIELCRQRVEKDESVWVRMRTKRTAEDRADYMLEEGLRV